MLNKDPLLPPLRAPPLWPLPSGPSSLPLPYLILQCRSLIEEYGDLIIKTIVNGELSKLCSVIGLCSSHTPIAVQVSLPKKLTNSECCSDAVTNEEKRGSVH